MVLVDTSVFIGYFKEVDESPYRKMRYLVDNGIPYGICNHVYQELLQGALSGKEWSLLKKYLGSLPFFDLMSLPSHSLIRVCQATSWRLASFSVVK